MAIAAATMSILTLALEFVGQNMCVKTTVGRTALFGLVLLVTSPALAKVTVDSTTHQVAVRVHRVPTLQVNLKISGRAFAAVQQYQDKLDQPAAAHAPLEKLLQQVRLHANIHIHIHLHIHIHSFLCSMHRMTVALISIGQDSTT